MLSRWKLMAGILGVSIGGLAAAASQCPKWDKSKGRSAEAPVSKADADMKLPPAGAPAMPPMGELPPLPAAPQLTPAGSTPPAPPPPATNALPPVPDFPTLPTPTPEPKPTKPEPKPTGVTPTAGTLPALPPIPASATAPASKPTEPAKPEAGTTPAAPGGITEVILPPPSKPTPPPPMNAASPAPPKPMDFQSGPSAAGLDLGPPVPPAVTPPAGPDGRDLIGKPNLKPVTPAGGTQPTPPNAGNAASPVIPPAAAPAIDVPPLKPEPVAAPVAESKFRILLRVGEGTPTFEVKHGDNLVLKVACEKVDIKSPEKGAGPSEITARGKVRFAGFGAEGTCDELKFLAGTGEVQMSGEVKVQVKDKLGRVESELTTGSLKYKIDASAVGGQLKP